MAAAAFPGIERFQQVGEGLFETLVRVSSTVESVTASLGLLGSSSAAMSTDLKMALAGQFESVGAFSSAVDAYFDTYYSKEEQAAARTAQMAQAFDSLGTAMPDSIAAFRALVDVQDLTTTAGQSTYATLLQLAPAFADLKTSMDGAKSAADILSEKQDLDRQLLEQQGNTAALRELDLAQIDESNRALKLRIWALQDEAQAVAAAAEITKSKSALELQIMGLEGNAAGVLIAQRAQELAGMDESLRPLQQRVYLLQDEAEAVAKAAEIAKSKGALEIQIMQLQGNAAGALAAQRAVELAGMDESLRPLQERVYLLQDENEAVARAAVVAKSKSALEIQIMQLQGNTAGALAAQRAIELASMDESLRPLQERVYLLQDEAEAAAKVKAINDERYSLETQSRRRSWCLKTP